jgi:CubicO group peptidase (beta-lactamase class C family)
MIRSLFIAVVISVVPAFAQDNIARMDKFMQQYNDNRGFAGTVIVAENGTITYARGFGLANREKEMPNGPKVQYRIASISKTFTATMIMKLAEQGKLTVHDPISRFLPGYRKDVADKVMIHHLLTHSSGIPNYVDSPEWRKQVAQPMPSLDFLIRTYCSGDLEFEPGSKYAYSNSGYVLLGAIIEQVTGMTFDKALHTMILDPAGMKDSGLDCAGLDIPQRAEGYLTGFPDDTDKAEQWNMDWTYSAGGIYATPEDMVKWDQALYDAAVISKPSLKLMTAPYFLTPQPGFSYGYGFNLSRRVKLRSGDSVLVMSHAGGVPGMTSLFSRVLANHQMVFVVSNTSGAPLAAITQGIFEILNGYEPVPPIKSLAFEMSRAISTEGLQAATRSIQSTLYANKSSLLFSENEMNNLGYSYLRRQKLPEAEAVFSMNVREFPRSWNVYDSLGECYVAMGKKEKAISMYKKSLELNSKNTAGAEELKKLGAD